MGNNLAYSGLKKIAIAILSQAIILVLSVVSSFILPQAMGPADFGYWQIYAFYLNYVNLFGLGFNDGLVLYYGGEDFGNLPYHKIRAAMRLLYAYYGVIVVVGLGAIFLLFKSPTYQVIYSALILSIPMTCLQCIILSIILAVGKTEIYNLVNLIQKITSVSVCIFLLFKQVATPTNLIYADLGVRAVITVACLWLGKDCLFGPIESYRTGWNELFEKSKAGIQITIALIASSLIPVMGRWVIEQMAPISVYGIYSFAVSLLSIILAFTSVVGTVVFPLLKRLDQETLSKKYSFFALTSDSLILLALFAYIPLMLILQYIMTEYLPVIEYLHILLAMCLPLSRIQLLIMPYYKAMRMEKTFLLVNLISAACMFCATMTAYLITHSVFAVAISTTVVMVGYEALAEWHLLKRTGQKFLSNRFFWQIGMMLTFVFATSFKSCVLFITIYLPAVFVYFYFHRHYLHKKMIFKFT